MANQQKPDPKPAVCQWIGCTNKVVAGVKFCVHHNPTWEVAVTGERYLKYYVAVATVLRNSRPAVATGQWLIEGGKPNEGGPLTTDRNGQVKFDVPYASTERNLLVVFPDAPPARHPVPLKPSKKALDVKPTFKAAAHIAAYSVRGTSGTYIYVVTTDETGNSVPGSFFLILDRVTQAEKYHTSDGSDDKAIGTCQISLEGFKQPRDGQVVLVGGKGEKGEHASAPVHVHPKAFMFEQPELLANNKLRLEGHVVSHDDTNTVVMVESYAVSPENAETPFPCFFGVQTGHLPFFIKHTSDGVTWNGFNDLPEIGSKKQIEYQPRGMTLVTVATPTKPSQLRLRAFAADVDTTPIELPVVERKPQLPPVMMEAGLLGNLLAGWLAG